MKILTGRLYLDKVDQTRIMTDRDSREYIELVLIENDVVLKDGKAGVLQQNTGHGEKRIYLANLFKSLREGPGLRKMRKVLFKEKIDPGACNEVRLLESRLFKNLGDS